MAPTRTDYAPLRTACTRRRQGHVPCFSLRTNCGDRAMTTVDAEYWRRYYQVHNEARFVELVDTFYHPDASFANPRKQFNGRDELISYFQGAGEFAKLTLTPTEIWVKPDSTATELEFTAEATADIPGFLTGPLKAGETARIKMAATYRLKDALIVQALVFWGQEIC